jgi:ankyrin repeat protein
LRLIGVHGDDSSDRSIIASNLAAALLRCGHHDKAALAASKVALELDPANVKAKKRREVAEAKLNAKKTHDRTLWSSDELRRLLLEETAGVVVVDERALAKQQRIKEALNNASLQETKADRSRDLKIRDTEGQDELITAAMQGNVRCLKRCLREGHDPNVMCNRGTKDTPLMLAACYTKLECAKLLIQQGACARMETWSGRSAT